VSERERPDILQLFLEGTQIDAALRRSVEQAKQLYRQAGLPMAIWRDGRTVWVSPDELEPEDPGPSATPQ
jgi:hypothetical protein